MIILGLDISTVTVGYTLIKSTILNKKEILIIGFIKPIGENLFEKVNFTINELKNELNSHTIDKIYAEQPNIMFRQGFSSAQTISTILRFNGALLFALFQTFKIIPHEAMAISMRKKVIGIGRFKNNPKQEILNWVTNVAPEIIWPLVKKGKNKGKLINECFDMADSFIVACFGLINEQCTK